MDAIGVKPRVSVWRSTTSAAIANMNSTANWWPADVDWSTPAGQLLKTFIASLPPERPFHLTLYGSAPLQLTVDRNLLSGDVDIFSDDDEDLSCQSLNETTKVLHLPVSHPGQICLTDELCQLLALLVE